MADLHDQGFSLTSDHDEERPDFKLAAPSINESTLESEQLPLPYTPSAEEPSSQLGFEEMPTPSFSISIQDRSELATFTKGNLLTCLEDHGVAPQFQCRAGYCGYCRVKLVKGEVVYHEEPMAWINDGEALPCCSIPKSDLVIKLL